MAWQKTKIWMVFKGTDKDGKPVVSRRAISKSKGSGKNVGQPTKLKLKMYCKETMKHEEYIETKFK